MTAALAIVGVIVLTVVLLVGWSIIALAGDIDQDREDQHGERRS